MLPTQLAETHGKHHSPNRASLLQSAVTATIVGVFMLFNADPFLDLFAWLVGLGTVAVLTLMAFTSLAVIGYFRSVEGEVPVWSASRHPRWIRPDWQRRSTCRCTTQTLPAGIHSGPVTYLPLADSLGGGSGFFVWWVKREKPSADVTRGLDEAREGVPGTATTAL